LFNQGCSCRWTYLGPPNLAKSPRRLTGESLGTLTVLLRLPSGFVRVFATPSAIRGWKRPLADGPDQGQRPTPRSTTSLLNRLLGDDKAKTVFCIRRHEETGLIAGRWVDRNELSPRAGQSGVDTP
jgi:hypothetical protein